MRFICFALIVMLTGIGQARDWETHENRERADGKTKGWSFDHPKGWLRVDKKTAPPPLADGYQSPDGKSWIVVTWLGEGGWDEQVTQLEALGFQRGDGRMGGRKAVVLKRQKTDRVDRVTFVRLPDGGRCRVAVGSRNAQSGELLGQLESSFKFLTLPDKVESHQSEVLNYMITLPEGWSVKSDSANKAQLLVAGKPHLTLVRMDGPAGQSMRGHARSLPPKVVPDLVKITEFEPFRTDTGLQGYLSVWKTKTEEPRVFGVFPDNGKVVVFVVEPNFTTGDLHTMLRSLKLKS